MNTAVAASTPQQRAPHQAQLCGRVADPGQPYVPPRGRRRAVSAARAAASSSARRPAQLLESQLHVLCLERA